MSSVGAEAAPPELPVAVGVLTAFVADGPPVGEPVDEAAMKGLVSSDCDAWLKSRVNWE